MLIRHPDDKPIIKLINVELEKLRRTTWLRFVRNRVIFLVQNNTNCHIAIVRNRVSPVHVKMSNIHTNIYMAVMCLYLYYFMDLTTYL